MHKSCESKTEHSKQKELHLEMQSTEGKSWKNEISYFMFQHRSTPHTGTDPTVHNTMNDPKLQ